VEDWLRAEVEFRAEPSTGSAAPITRVVFARDESGAKGYTDQDEAYDGEV
jgi:hypothetical protein